MGTTRELTRLEIDKYSCFISNTKKIKRFMTWHAVDSQSTHIQPIYHGGPKVLVEVPNAPDWAAC
jgi:hypothetical protein